MEWVRFHSRPNYFSARAIKDICCAYNENVTIKEVLSEVCSNIDTYHKKLYDSVVTWW